MIKSNLKHTTFWFPVGEMQVNTIDAAGQRVNVEFTFTKNEDIIELLLFCDAAQRNGHELGTLTMPYVPFSRQDRTNHHGESLSLAVFCNLINDLKFEYVVISDPHSDVTPALLHNVSVLSQAELMLPLLRETIEAPFYLISPDAGAFKKIHALARMIQERSDSSLIKTRFLGVIEAGKIRNTATGEITGTVIHAAELDTKVTQGDVDTPIVYAIVDDICDGGRTFLELSKELRLRGVIDIQLYVTHGFFTKGKTVFTGAFDKVRAVHDYSKEVGDSWIWSRPIPSY